ncbi:Transcription initiation factor TFIIE, beta subunit [Beauveria brongniartii RCEF 3172]|uniref:Transcription initiation factor IIE subunit beta n=1 Tax=Beauveria brongniartii RCEF 3172 TaxID=1081107 RepID=A0A162M8T8_9HYPO|nr:Transcription initiation factor TFIIE, beta subunit [Beauveria brongniartii RCEF 3172]
MSSYLEKQSAAFKGTLASAASKLSNPMSVKAAALAPPSPSPSAASDGATPTPTAKRKREAHPEVYSQPQLTGYGVDVKSHMKFAVDFLKARGAPKSMKDIIDHLSVRNTTDEHKQELAEGLRGHPRVEWRPDTSLSEQTWRTGTYSYRAVVPGVTDATSLLAFLQRKTDASSLAVRDLKDGWPDCEDTLARLEAQHKILVTRTNRENFPRHVWLDDASLHHAIQPEFQALWRRVQIPSVDDMHRKLTNASLKPTSEDPRKMAAAAGNKPKAQKKRASKRGGKQTNVHMTHLLQDYSNLRR